MSMILVYSVIYAWVLIAILWAISQTKGFLDINDRVFVVGIIAGVLLIFPYGMIGFAAVILVNGVLLGLGLYLRDLEKQARSLPAASDYLAEQHKRISETWVKKPWPDF